MIILFIDESSRSGEIFSRKHFLKLLFSLISFIFNNNSFRGYRGLWYHSYGLNSALGYVYLANLWGAEVPNTVINKITKAAEVLNLGITNYESFSSRKYYGEQKNNQYKKHNARKHTHQDALAIDTLMEMVTGIKLENDTTYLAKRSEYGIDDLIGFNANCIK